MSLMFAFSLSWRKSVQQTRSFKKQQPDVSPTSVDWRWPMRRRERSNVTLTLHTIRSSSKKQQQHFDFLRLKPAKRLETSSPNPSNKYFRGFSNLTRFQEHAFLAIISYRTSQHVSCAVQSACHRTIAAFSHLKFRLRLVQEM